MECLSGHKSWPTKLCYHCKKESNKFQRLKDGCNVPICYNCEAMCKEIFQNISQHNQHHGVLHSKNKGGEIMADIPEANTRGQFLGQKTVLDKKINRITILDEAQIVDSEYQGKVSKRVQCTVKGDNGEEYTWQMNKNTQNWCREKFGPDSKTWINKDIDIQVKTVGNMSPSIYPTELKLERVLN